MTGLKKDLPYLNGYLQEMRGREPVARGFHNAIPWGVGIASIPFIASVGGANPTAGIASILGVVGVMGGLLVWNRRQKTPRTDAEAYRLRAWPILAKFQERCGPRRLRKSLHPAAAQVLEACAVYRAKIVQVLESPSWAQLAESDHWKAMKRDSLHAADSAMLEALVSAEPFLGSEKKTQDKDFMKFVEDLLDGDLDDAFEGIGRAFGWERDEEFRHWEAIPEQLHSAYNVAVKLKKLSMELERQAKDIERNSREQRLQGSGSLDSVLQNLEQLRVAEKELEQQVRLRG